MITLIVVNCQNDYITGTICSKMNKGLAENIKTFISKNKDKIEKIIFAVEWHPYNHCSFKKYGGESKAHCIQYTPGACIEPKLLKLVQSLEMNFEVSRRGEEKDDNPKGAFSNIERSSDFLGKTYYLDVITSANAESEFVICGIDIKDTLRNMINEGIKPKVLYQGVDYNGLISFIKENNIQKI